jgi:hypothetical protein
MKAIRLLLLCSVVLTVGAAKAFDVFLPPAGEDLFPATNALVMVEFPQGMMHNLMCSGPTRVRRGDPMGEPLMIETELLQLDLACANGIMIHLADSGRRSMGMTMSSGESFFDVFVEISVPMQMGNHTTGPGPTGPAGPQPIMLRNCANPVRVRSMIGHVPPLHSKYLSLQPVPLCDDSGPVGQLVSVEHDVNGVPKPESSGEVSPVFSCFYECKKAVFIRGPLGAAVRGPRPWQEITTLMLVNQSAAQPLQAEILFVDGRQTPIAKTTIRLSPLDLDEINVCETLELGAIQVPPAGVIEVVLSPTGGAYGWVKNVTGKFHRGVAEPFGVGQEVTGIGKTECRLVGPNVATPAQLRSRLEQAPPVVPVLIEGTADEAL